MAEQVIITIDAVGRPTIEAKGFVGKGCDAATKVFEEALTDGGADVIKEYKPEYYKTPQVKDQTVQLRNW